MQNPAFRPEGSLRPYNQDQILSIAYEFRFEPLYSEKLATHESIRRLLQAEYVVGTQAAGWANALFTERGRGSLIWTWDEGLRENWFHNVLLARGIQVKIISTGPGSNATPYTLDPVTFRDFLGDLTRNQGKQTAIGATCQLGLLSCGCCGVFSIRIYIGKWKNQLRSWLRHPLHKVNESRPKVPRENQ